MNKKIHAALGTAMAAALVLASTPAFAVPRSLPAGDVLYAFSCDDAAPAVGIVDVATGAVTEVVPALAGQCFSGPAYNAADGKIYVVDWRVNSDLVVFDPVAETVTVVAAFDCDPYALAIDESGNAWVWDGADGNIKPVDLETAACGTGVGQVAGGDTFYAIAFAPNGTLYGANYSDGPLGSISTTDGTFTQVGTSAMVAGDNAGLTFDSSGIAWVVDEADNAEIYSADFSDYSGTAQLSGQLTFNGVDVYSEAIVVAPTGSEELADTGVSSSTLGLGGLVAVGLTALGASMMVRRRAS